ncbi:hypothetical protein JX265_006767 [Neoarthrinium moseri]|uniref:Uncharacterized protein n=1 Tax=Neoarthrinium moseri TaxID=1658444 RepID=A0A9P9WKR6_9PEZI|nr:hypothetical protein JX265_006767 [Neoarthrinium moseri]
MRARLEGDYLALPPPERGEQTETLSPENLDGEHLNALTTALDHLLRTELAEFTYAQIIDGYPTTDSFHQFDWHPDLPDHPVKLHTSLCDGVLEQARAFRAAFDPLSLRFKPCTLQAFQDQTLGSQPFHLRLFELLAVSCHQIAVFLFENGHSRHKKEYDKWRAEQESLKEAGDERYRWRHVPPPVVFYHPEHVDYEQYPRGLSDVVGYWAEAKIFGGVLLFDRGESDTDCKQVFLHSALLSGPITIFPPTVDQLEKLVSFLGLESEDSDAASTACPLPILASKFNRPRWYRYHATKYFHIFRDKYDSRLPLRFPWPDKLVGKDFPELDDQLWLMNHEDQVANDHVPLDEAAVTAAKQRLKNITPSSPLWGYDERYL